MLLSTTSKTSQNLTSVVNLLSYTATKNVKVGVDLFLGNLDPSDTATLRVFVTLTRSAVAYPSIFLADTKLAAANQTYHRYVTELTLLTGDVIDVEVQSTNNSDNNANSTVNLYDLTAANVTQLDGTAVVAASGRIGATLPDVDGVTNAAMQEALLAYISGRSTLTDNGDGTKTIVYRKKDNSTAALTITFDAQGQWTNTVIGV